MPRGPRRRRGGWGPRGTQKLFVFSFHETKSEKQSVSQTIDLVVTIQKIQESSKSELSSRFLSTSKFYYKDAHQNVPDQNVPHQNLPHQKVPCQKMFFSKHSNYKKYTRQYTKITFLLFSKLLPKNYAKNALTLLQLLKFQKKIVKPYLKTSVFL